VIQTRIAGSVLIAHFSSQFLMGRKRSRGGVLALPRAPLLTS
jgi:hypothetical protein